MLNTFPGFEAMNSIKRNGVRKSLTQFDESKVKPMLTFAKALAGEHLEYFLDWLAYPIQTGEKTEVALVVLGAPGCGKSTFFYFMVDQIYGGVSSTRLAQTIAGGKQLAGFNKHIASTMLLVIDEPTKFSVSLQQEFKNYITGDTQEVKEKFETAVFEANVTNYAFTTNTVPSRLFEADDRRFFVLQHDGTHVQDVPYLSSLRLAMKEGAEDFFLFLKNRKIKTFVLGEAPPQSSLKKYLRMSSSKQRGAVLVFSRDQNTNTRERTKEIVSPDTPPGERDEFCRSLAFDGSTLVVGAYCEGNDVKGAAYVFSADGRGVGSDDVSTTAVPVPSSSNTSVAYPPPSSDTAAPVLPNTSVAYPPPSSDTTSVPPESLVFTDYESSASTCFGLSTVAVSVFVAFVGAT